MSGGDRTARASAPPGPPAPVIDDDSRPYWDAARTHRLAILRCADCGAYAPPARPVCPACHGARLEWTTAAGGGTVYSFTVVRRAPSPAFTAPYVVALVDLDEGPRLLSTLRLADPAAAQVGQRVQVAFEEREDLTLPVFEPA